MVSDVGAPGRGSTGTTVRECRRPVCSQCGVHGRGRRRRRRRRRGEGNAGAGVVRVDESERGRRGRFLSGQPYRRRRLESRALGDGLDGAPVEEALGLPWRGTGAVNRRGRVERGLATLALGVWGTTQMSGTARRSVSVGQ
jgi:hypothetical protein